MYIRLNVAKAGDEKYNVYGYQRDVSMSDDEQTTAKSSDDDGFVDAIAAIALIVIPVLAIIFWLSGL